MTHVIVLGNGLAGLCAAIGAVEQGARVTILSASSPDRSQSVMAAGGINAALNVKGENDTTDQHFADTMHAGCDLADPEAVRSLTAHAPELIQWLRSIGVVFSPQKDGTLDQRPFGGQKKMRTAYARSGIGRQLVCALSSLVRRMEADGKIQSFCNVRFQSLIFRGERAVGCIVEKYPFGTPWRVYGDAVVVASGGLNGLFGKTTGSVLSSGSVSAMLFHQGAAMGNLEMIQYHPTTIETPMKRMLISEAARGEGGRLYVIRNGAPWYFMEDRYPEGGNLMPRDVVSRTAYHICSEQGYGQMYLTLTHLPPKLIDTHLSEVRQLCLTYLHLDPSKVPIPVSPGIHYFMGGLLVDRRHKTSIPGVWAAGECCCAYHGANRLGGNSTLGAIYGGFLAGRDSAKTQPISHTSTDDADDTLCVSPASEELQNILNSCMGIERNANELRAGLFALNALPQTCMTELGEALICSALERKESRGAHARSDYPDRNDAQYQRTTVARRTAEGISVTLCPIDCTMDWRLD